MAKKHRVRGVKREHSILEGALPLLERIAAQAAVDSVIPGRIRVIQSTISGVRVRAQTPTVSGLKLMIRSRNATQEVFVVTSRPSEVLAFLESEVPEFERAKGGPAG
jgi:hypothetical protein